jgi:chitodextrinase
MKRRILPLAVLTGVLACDSTPSAPPAAPPEPVDAVLTDAPVARLAPDPAGLVAHWDFDQGTGTTLPNVAGTSYNGTFAGSPTWTTGRDGGGLAFDGTDYVSTGTITVLDQAPQVTLAGWVKRNAPGGRVLMGRQLNGAGAFGIRALSDGTLSLFQGTSALITGSTAFNDTAWHHVALVFDGTLTGNENRLKAYVDGAPVALTYSGTIANHVSTSAAAFDFGRVLSSYSNGTIDDVWLFARALTPTEIQGLNDPTPPSVPGGVSATPVSSSRIDVSWTASTDDVGVAGYRVFRDGAEIATTTTTGYSNTGLNPSTAYTYRVSAYDAVGNTSAQSAPASATTMPPPDTVAPSLAITAPSSGATVTSTISVSASASDNVGVVGVQFRVDGADLGAEDTAAPWTVSWNSTVVADGSHTLTAVARDAAGNVSTSAGVPVTTSNGSPGSSAIFPLSVSADRRHLLDKNGAVFFINGDTPWELIQNLTLAEADTYLTDRKSKGFNSMLITLIERQFSPNPPLNENGDAPFTVPGDFSTPNEAYFAHVDAVLQKALEKDLTVFLTPAYLGYQGGSQGWYSEILANGPIKLRNFGRYLGNRYRNYPNVVWVTGGDFGPNAALGEIRELVGGIEEMAGPRLFSVHNGRFQSGVTQYQVADTWIDVNTTYADCATTPSYLSQDYARTWNGGPIPFVFIEGTYEPGNSGGVCYRAQAYWPVLMGGVGHFYGNDPLWNLNMGGNWQQYLDSPVGQDMIHWKNLFQSRATALLVPDYARTVLTAGFGAYDAGYAAAARTSDGRTVMVYVPTPRALTIDMTKVSGASAIAWWFNPDTGAATEAGTYPTTGTRSFTPPTSTDWILVIDDASAGYGPPGSGTVAPDVTPPSVSLTAPSGGATVSGTIALSASASDDIGVAGVQFRLDGANLGAEDTTAPYGVSWNTTSAAEGAHTLTAVARDAAGNTTTSANVGVTVDNVPDPDTSPPGVPTNLAATPVSSTQVNLTWSASTDNVGVTGYRVFRNGTQVGTPTSTGFSDTGLSASTTYSYTVAAADAAGNVSAQSAPVNATTLPPPDVTPPSVSVTAPASGATVAGTISVTASASDNVGVVGVQFRLDGVNLGAEDTAAPWSVSWNTTSATEGQHALSAVARDAAGNTTTSANVGVTVDNVPSGDTSPPTAPPNLVLTLGSPTQVDLTWGASTDNVGVTGYRVFRNGTQVGSPTSTTFSDPGRSPATTYTYRVRAVDAAGNQSPLSNPVTITTPQAGQVAGYGFNEGGGTVLFDKSGNGRNGTVQGSPVWSTGRNGLAINYDGVNDNVLIGDIPPIDGVGAVTVSAWMKRSTLNSRVLLGKQAVANAVAITMWPDGLVYFMMGNGSGSQGTFALNDGFWHHVALVFDGTLTGNPARLKAYVDGAPVTLAFNGTVPALTTSNTTPVNLGSVGGFFTSGQLDDVRIYNRALTQSEVQFDMNTPVP